jgi:hypothetical protein
MNLKQILALVSAVAIVSTQAAASGGTGGGGTGGGGGTTTINPLPSTPPAPGVILRESFGPGPDPILARPQGGNGNLRQVFAGTSLSGFWLEYPGSKSEAWVTPDPGRGWIFAFASLNPYETLPSPIQPDPFNGIAMSVWTDGVLAFPDALLPFRGASTRYSVSADLYPAYLPGSYVGFGLSTSGTLQSNLPASGQIWILLAQVDPLTGSNGRYEVRIGSQVLASGSVILDGFNPASIIVDPVAQTVAVTLKGVDLGTWAARVSPSFIALEGQGWADDLIVRTLP